MHVGYDTNAARQYQLDGKETKDAYDALPRLSVDKIIPYEKSKEVRQSLRKFSQPRFSQKSFASKVPSSNNQSTTAWSQTIQFGSGNFDTTHRQL